MWPCGVLKMLRRVASFCFYKQIWRCCCVTLPSYESSSFPDITPRVYQYFHICIRPFLSVILPRYVNVSTSYKASSSSVICMRLTVAGCPYAWLYIQFAVLVPFDGHDLIKYSSYSVKGGSIRISYSPCQVCSLESSGKGRRTHFQWILCLTSMLQLVCYLVQLPSFWPCLKAYFFNCWWDKIYGKIWVCCIDVRWSLCGWSI